MNAKRLELIHNIAVIAADLEKVESIIASVSACINRNSTSYLKKKLNINLDNLISQRSDLIADLNDAIDRYNSTKCFRF